MKLELNRERLKQCKVWILIPAAGDLIHSTFARCLIQLTETLRAYGITSNIMFLPGDSLVTRARNNLSQMFMAASSDPDSHFCLWLDCDILFDPVSVLQMLSLDLDFVSAPYSKKGVHQDRLAEAARLNWPNDRMMAVVGTPNVNWLVHPVRCDEPVPVLEAGTGFWLVKRKVFEQMESALPEIKYRRSAEEHAHYGEESYAYFLDGIWPETREFISEDWWFCRTWRKLGGVVYCCFWIKTNHIGPYMYPMDMPAIADLLTATGGYINGPTKEKSDAPKEDAATGITGYASTATAAKCAVTSTGSFPASSRASTEAAIPSHTGSLGWRAGDRRWTAGTLPWSPPGEGPVPAGQHEKEL